MIDGQAEILNILIADSASFAEGLTEALRQHNFGEPLFLETANSTNEALELLITGYSNKVIARELGIAESTIKVHVSALLRTLGVQSRAQAIAKFKYK